MASDLPSQGSLFASVEKFILVAQAEDRDELFLCEYCGIIGVTSGIQNPAGQRYIAIK
jgi:hypothetical protein